MAQPERDAGLESRMPMEPESEVRRSAVVATAMGCDIILNYPLWVAAKRLGVGLPAFPGTFRGIYVGAGSLFMSLAPTVIIEDTVTRLLRNTLDASENDGESSICGVPSDLICSATSGAVAACFVASPVEHLITRSHALESDIFSTVHRTYISHGFMRVLVPPGLTAMIGREIPFAASLFWLQPTLSKLFDDLNKDAECNISIAKYLCVGVATSAVATPISHIPSVVAAYQQGHGVGIKTAVQELYSVGGFFEFWRGLAARTVSLAGTMTVVPFVMHALASEPKH